MLKVIGKQLGSGGYGVVEHVVDEQGQHFARKRFHIAFPEKASDDIKKNVLERFRREVKAQADIKHKNVVEILHADLTANPPYYLMPLAESTLHEDLVADPTLGGFYVEAMLDILAGLEVIHGQNMTHRDLKPKNILRFSDKNGKKYYAIGDFGFVSVKESQLSSLTKTGMRLQWDDFISPEVARNLKDGTSLSDIYSAGCILHAMVSTNEREPLTEIRESGPYGQILSVCTRRDADKRFPSVMALRDAILNVGGTENLSAATPGNDLITSLNSSNKLTRKEWEEVESILTTEISKDSISDDAKAILTLLDKDRINELAAHNQKLFIEIGLVIASWAKEHGFGFGFCDILADRLELLLKLGDTRLGVQCIMGLLYLGTDHNRFYVEGLFMRNARPSMDDELARGVAIEFTIEKNHVCRAISHLEKYYNVRRESLHPSLVSTLESICK
jgi:serine/threonine protein kinase